jgi:L-ribulose-5-phosphate 3-epimerase
VNPLGIMQGRLSPPTPGRIQSFPIDTWRDEFLLAKKAGLDYVEWVYQADTEAANPLSGDNGLEDIRRVMIDSGVSVCSVSADYYMTHRLVANGGGVVDAAVEHLRSLLKRARQVGAHHVMLPFVDGGSLQTEAEIAGLGTLLRTMKPFLDECGDIEVHMETDLEPEVWAGVLQQASSRGFRVCYDIGDRASQGYDPVQDFKYLGRFVGSVHIKDRVRGGGSVPLGTGDADFSTCFGLIRSIGYGGPFVLQTARDASRSESDLAVRNRQFVLKYLTDDGHGHQGCC